MNARAVVFGSWLLLGFGSFVLVPACGGTDTLADDDDTADDDQSSSGGSSSGGKSSSGGSSSGGKSSSGGSSGASTSSSGGPDDAGAEDATVEEPIDPDPGDACPTVGQEFTRNCGDCGTQNAYCSPAHVVGGYGACKEGTRSCGVDAGTDASVADSGPGVPDSGTTGTIATLVLGTAVNATTTILLPDSQGRLEKPLNEGGKTFTCPLTLSAETTEFAYVLVQNPNAVAAKIDLTVVGGGDSYLVVYPSVPSTPAARKACTGFFDNGCGKYIGPGCLLGASSPTVPAGGSVVAYIARYAVPSLWEDPTLKAVVKALP